MSDAESNSQSESSPVAGSGGTPPAQGDPLGDLGRLVSEGFAGIQAALSGLTERVEKVEAKPAKGPAPRKTPEAAKPAETTPVAPEAPAKRSHGRGSWLYGK